MCVAEWISQRAKEGLVPHEFGVFVRSEREFDRAIAAVKQTGVPFKILDEKVETIGGHACIGTMHLLQHLREHKLLRGETLTVPGWARVRELRKVAGDSTQAFVAMWFGYEVDEAYEDGVKPAIKKAGYTALRIDKKEHSNRIDDEIILEINRSRFVVADFTGHRPGVCFEAGYALGQKKPVIWTCRKDYLNEAHFDTRQYNHIGWDTATELRERLYNRIAVLVG